MRNFFLLSPILIVLASSCKMSVLTARDPAPMLAAPIMAKMGGVQVAGGYASSTHDSRGFMASPVLLGQAQGYYAFSKHGFIEGTLAGAGGKSSYSDGYETAKAVSLSALPGIGFYAGSQAVSFVASAGFGYTYSYFSYSTNSQFGDDTYGEKANLVSVYEKLGLRFRFGPAKSFGLYAGVQVSEQLLANGQVDRNRLIGGELTPTPITRRSGINVNPLLGVNVGKPGGVNLFIQASLGQDHGYSTQTSSEEPTFRYAALIGFTIPLARAAAP